MPPPETTEAAPPAVITPEVQEKAGMGPMPVVTKFGDKFRAEMAKVEATVKPTEAPPEPVKKDADAVQTPPEPDKKPADAVETPEVKPESPLDVVIEKAPKAEKPAEATDVLADLEKIEVPKSEHWKRARETMRQQAEELKTLKSAPKTQEPVKDELSAKRIEELEQTLADREARLKAAGVEHSADYQVLVGKYQATAEKIRTRMQSFGADGDSLLAALSLPYSKIRTDQIDAVMADLDVGKQVKVQKLIDDLEGHGEEIAEFRKDLPARYEEMTVKQEQAAREQHVNALKQLETEFVKISETIPDSIVTMREVPDDVPGGTEWNKEIQEARTNALRVLKPDGADFNESVSIALKGARYDTLEKRYLSLHKDYRELKKSYAALDSSGPDFKGGSKPTAKVDKPRGVRYHEALAQRRAAGDDT